MPALRRIRVHYASHSGLMRPANEDSLRIGDFVVTGGQSDSVTTTDMTVEPNTWIAVADGLGGHGSGHVASAIAVHALGQPANRLYDEAGIRGVPGYVLQQLRRRAERDDVSPLMGTTLSALCFTPAALFLLHIGDCRIYTLPDFRRLSRDDTQIQELIEAGEVPEEMRALHPLKNRLTRSLVAGSNVPAAHVQRLNKQDEGALSFLLCSDGLWENFSDEEMKAQLQTTLQHGLSLAAFAQWLLDSALARGGRDNITLLLTEPAV